jgi:hypothetical protein
MSIDPPNAPTDLKFKPTTIVYVRSVDASRPDRQCYDYFGTTNPKERVLARAKQIFGDDIIISYGGCK